MRSPMNQPLRDENSIMWDSRLGYSKAGILPVLLLLRLKKISIFGELSWESALVSQSEESEPYREPTQKTRTTQTLTAA
jgi:hypothetical protein